MKLLDTYRRNGRIPVEEPQKCGRFSWKGISECNFIRAIRAGLAAGLTEAQRKYLYFKGAVLGKKGSQTSLPESVLKVRDPRIKRLVQEVWQKIPDYDQQAILSRTEYISENLSGGSNLAAVHCDFPEKLSPQALLTIKQKIKLSLLRRYPISDQAARWIIAHELAHVILRHDLTGASYLMIEQKRTEKFGPRPERRTTLTKQERWYLSQIEDHANLQALLWGFDEEYELAREELRVAPRWEARKRPKK